MSKIFLFVIALFVLPLLGEESAMAQRDVVREAATSTPPGVEPRVVARLRSIRILLNGSSVSRKVEAAGVEQAVSLLREARSTWDTARSLHEAGDDPAAEQNLDRCVQLVTRAVRESRDAFSDKERLRAAFASKEASVLALLSAQRRVAEEKGHPAGSREARESAEGLLTEARRLFAAESLVDALLQLDLSYRTVRLSLFSLRNGDSLDNRKEFASKAEEYAYELDRNESYRMFVFVLLDGKGLSKQVVAQIQALCEEADAVARRAKEQAASGSYGEAIVDLWVSSRLLARAIRLGGVYIPD